MSSKMSSGIYGVAVSSGDATTICYVGRSRQLERRLVVLRHAPWVYGDVQYTPVPLVVEPFPEPHPPKVVEQAAMEFYAEQPQGR